MTSVTKRDLEMLDPEDRAQLLLGVYLGEIVVIEDPETGERYIGASQKGLDMVSGRCAEEERRARHARQASPWPMALRVRLALTGVVAGMIIAVALPVGAGSGSRAGIERIIDDPDPSNNIQPSGDTTSRLVEATTGAAAAEPMSASPHAMSTAKAKPAPTRTAPVFFAPGPGKHRAPKRSAWLTRIGKGIGRGIGRGHRSPARQGHPIPGLSAQDFEQRIEHPLTMAVRMVTVTLR